MPPNGLLYLGGAETAMGVSPFFEPDTVYRPARARPPALARR
jgi:hypothetical protein